MYKLVFLDTGSKQSVVEKALLPLLNEGYEIDRMDTFGKQYCYFLVK